MATAGAVRTRITEEGVTAARHAQDEQARAYRLRQVRESRMARQADVAAQMKVSQSRVSRIEAATSPTPR